jgi:hypothetical protein
MCFENVSSHDVCQLVLPSLLTHYRALFPLDRANVLLALQVQPELRTVAEIAAEPYGGIGRNRAAGIEDVRDAAGGHANIE